MKKKERLSMNRRDFLKASATAGAAGVAVLSEGAYGRSAGMGPKEVVSESTLPKDLNSASQNVNLLQNQIVPTACVVHDPKICVGCNTCVPVCHQDVLVPNPTKGKPPIVVWPDECFQDGLCVLNCPLGLEAKAIRLNTALCQRTRWKRKATGEHFRLGMKGVPPPNMTPPIGGWFPHS
jgi:NAD-dependent dihydropyrimidine dehydrogenase PreA subunit